jgi:hypothetical protein
MPDAQPTPKPETKPEAKPAPKKVTQPRKEDYVLIKNMASSRETRHIRSSSRGHRYNAIVLDTGRRIRQKGDRLTEVSLHDLLANHQQILELVRVGKLQVFAPDQALLQYEELKGLVQHLAKGKALDLTGAQSEKDSLALRLSDKDASAQGGAEESDEEDEDEDEKGDEGPEASEEPSETTPADSTEPDAGLSAETAKEGEVTSPSGDEKGTEPESEDDGYSEEELLAMNRKDLNKIAEKEFRVKHPEKLGSKQEVVEAILNASKKE